MFQIDRKRILCCLTALYLAVYSKFQVFRNILLYRRRQRIPTYHGNPRQIRHIETKHQKQTQKEAAEIKHQEGPIDVSNVMYYDAKTKAPTRIGYKVENGKKVRVSKKTGAVID